MKNKAWLAGLILVLALLACSLPTQATETPTEEKTSVAHTTEEIATEEELEVVAETVAATETPEQPLPVVYGSGDELVVLDPVTGAEISRLSAPEFGIGGKGGVSANGIFYIDYGYLNAHRVGYDNVLQELLFLNPDGGYFEGLILPSPDGLQVAQGAIMGYDPSGSHVQLKVFNVDGTDERILLDKTLDQPLRPTPIKWSADGEILYYTNVVEGIEGYGGLDLYKVYLDLNASEQIFPEASRLVSVSVSPNETYAAQAIPGDSAAIMIRDLENATNQTVTLPDKYKQVWQMVWAPDDSAMLVTVGQGMFVEGDAYSVIKIDLTTLDTSYLVMDDPNLLSAVAWQALETIWLVDTDSTLWKMNSGDLSLTMVAANAQVIGISR